VTKKETKQTKILRRGDLRITTSDIKKLGTSPSYVGSEKNAIAFILDERRQF
jgi:hypothetical protein